MLFSSLTFLFIFLPILLVIYFLFKNIKIKNIILLIASLFFYSWGEPKYIFLMLFVVFASYVFGLFIDHFQQSKQFNYKKFTLILAIVTILGILGLFKYLDFLILNINNLLNMDLSFYKLILPIGISFYSFQILSYIIDLYRGKVKVQRSLIDLSLYVSLFPQLIAGPIVRYETVEKELESRKTTLNDVIYGVKRFILGLSKKVIIANQMALVADTIFNYDKLGEWGTIIIWLGSLAYVFQIYFDFSGYSDMAIGLGRIFGFHFLENFNQPYLALSVTNFWQRWHISLSSWFKDYVYIPLGGNRVRKWKWIRNILVVWTLTGLWHGASWNYILWGLYFGLILLFEKLVGKHYLTRLPKVISWFYTFMLIVISMVIFRNENLGNLLVSLQQMFVFKSSDLSLLISQNVNIIFAFSFFIPAVIVTFVLPQWKVKYLVLKDKTWFTGLENCVILGLFIICLIFLISSTYNPFIYFRF